jgi:predicted nucleic-acid-binding Zn-ribbon protein
MTFIHFVCKRCGLAWKEAEGGGDVVHQLACPRCGTHANREEAVDGQTA